MSSHAYEKAACLAFAETAYNMLVAIHPYADGAVWEWKEAEKVPEKRSEAFPDRRSTREGPLIVSPSPSQSLPLCFRRSSIPPPTPPVS